MKRLLVLLAMVACAGAQAETWYWYGGTKHASQPTWGGDVNKAANWTNETHTLSSGGGIPARGDDVVFNGGVNKTTSNNGVSTNPWGDIYVGNGCKDFMQVFFCQVAGNKLRAEKDFFGTSGYYLYGNGESEIVSINNNDLKFQKPFLAKEGKPTLVKNGTWKLTCYYQGGSRDYTIPYTRIKQGTINITSEKVNTGLSFFFDGDDATQCFEFTTSGHVNDFQIKDSAFIETNGVANTGHSISAPYGPAQLVFTGVPLVNPMVFSGTFKTKAGLTWSPSSADSVFVCSNAVSSTSASILVQKGTVKLVTGASFTNAAEVAVAAGAVFEVADAPAEPFKVAALTLADATARVKAGEGVTITFTAASLNGVALAPGTYAQTPGAGEREAAWLEGAGKVVVETGPGNAATWDGGGADVSVSTAANWSNDESPDLATGEFLATFASGGSSAALAAGQTAKFAGFILDNSFGGDAFSFTAGDGATAEIGASGLTADKAASATTWTMGWPLVLAEDQTWTLGANDTLALDGGLSGAKALTFANDGTVVFSGTGTHSGTLNLVKGRYRVTATDGLGTSRTISYPQADVNLAFGGTISVASGLSGTSFVTTDAATANAIELEAGADVTFNKLVTFSSNGTLRYGAGAKATFRNGLKTTISAVHGSIYVCGSGGALVVTNTAMTIARGFSVNGSGSYTADFHTSGNRISGDEWGYFKNTTLRMHRANAFAEPTRLRLDGSTLELAGGEHTLRDLSSSATSAVMAKEPVVLKLSLYSMGDNHLYGGTNRTNAAVFSGPLSLVKTGDHPFCLGAASSATGGLSVAQGILTLSDTCSWPNCTNVSVAAGATLKVKNANAFGDTSRAAGEDPVVKWQVASTATVNLDFEGTVRAAELRVDGKRISGSIGAVGSGADYEVAWITGNGRLQADAKGLVILLR